MVLLVPVLPIGRMKELESLKTPADIADRTKDGGSGWVRGRLGAEKYGRRAIKRRKAKGHSVVSIPVLSTESDILDGKSHMVRHFLYDLI